MLKSFWRNFTYVAVAVLLLTRCYQANPALAQTPAASCPTTIDARQALAIATVDVASPCRRDPRQTIKVYYQDDVFLAHFDADGHAQLSFVLMAPHDNKIRIAIGEGKTETRVLEVPDFDSVYRITMIWTAPVQLKLHVVEPGARLNQMGDISGDQPNTDLRQGLGRMDLAWGAPEVDSFGEQTSAEQSYAIPDPFNQHKGVFSPYLMFATRGATPQPPFCGENKLASISYRVVVIDSGRVSETEHESARAPCGVPLKNLYQRT